MNRFQGDAFRALFPTLISMTRFEQFETENTKLLDLIRQIRREDEHGEQQSGHKYTLGYTSYFSRPNLQQHPGFETLLAYINSQALRLAEFIKIDLSVSELTMREFWINVNPKYSYHQEHNHPNAHFSGVYYAKTPENCGRIIFRDPREARSMFTPPYTEKAAINADIFNVNPVAGGLIVFPAWLYHAVEQNMSEEERVSLSFNFEMAPRRTLAQR